MTDGASPNQSEFRPELRPDLTIFEQRTVVPWYASIGVAATILLAIAADFADFDRRFYVLAVFASLIVAPTAIAFHVRARSRLRRLLNATGFRICPTCRQILDARNASGRCPECGLDYEDEGVCAVWHAVVDRASVRTGKRFWARQFDRQTTAAQTVFDVFAGILMPIACLALDPIVFNADGMLSQLWPLAYTFVAMQISALAAWLLLRRVTTHGRNVLTGVFAAGAAGAMLTGLAMLPFTLIGLFAVIGALGLTPLATALVFARSARRSWLEAPRRSLVRAMAAAAIVVASASAAQTFVHTTVRTANRTIINWSRNGTTDIESAVTRLRWIATVRPEVAEPLVIAWYDGNADPEQTARLADAYERVTGRLIDTYDGW